MLDVSEKVKRAYLIDNLTARLSFTIDGKHYGIRDIPAGTVQITESLCSLETLSFSTVEKNELRFALFNENQTIKGLLGKSVVAEHAIIVPEHLTPYVERIPLGTYTIVDVVKDGDYILQCTCYDAMLAFDAIIDDWWNKEITFPITIKDLVIALFNKVGIDYSLPETFTNSTFEITNRPVFFENTKASELLGYIQEIVGGFFKADRYGVVRLLNARKLDTSGLTPKIGLYPHAGLYPAASDVIGFGDDAEVQNYTYRQIFGELTTADYATNKITSVQIRGTADDVGVVVGDGRETYVIEGNPLLFNITDATGRPVAENILNAIRGITYVPFTGEFKSMPFLEVGDCVYVTTYKGNLVKSPIFYRVLQSQELSIDSFTTKGTKERHIVKTTNRTLTVLNQRTHELVNTVDEFRSTIEETQTAVDAVEATVETHTTQIAQNANSINLSAKRSGIFNLLINSDFSNQSNHTQGWGKENSVSTTEYVYDSAFYGTASDYNKIENGHCLKVTFPTATVKNGTLYQDINYNDVVNDYIQVQMTYRVVQWDGNAKIAMSLRAYDENGDASGYYITQFISFVEGNTGTFRSVIASVLRGTRVGKLRFGLYLTNATGTNIVEYNHILATFTPTNTYLPFYSWTNYASKDIISQINIEPTGITIQGEKVDIKGITTFSSSSSGTTVIDGGTVTLQNLKAGSITSGTMSADRISGGTLKLGGSNNTNGILTIQNASGTTIGTWNKDGISVTGGTISGATIQSTVKMTWNYSGSGYSGTVTAQAGSVSTNLTANGVSYKQGLVYSGSYSSMGTSSPSVTTSDTIGFNSYNFVATGRNIYITGQYNNSANAAGIAVEQADNSNIKLIMVARYGSEHKRITLSRDSIGFRFTGSIYVNCNGIAKLDTYYRTTDGTGYGEVCVPCSTDDYSDW